jgi:hypothetical protein
MKKDCKQRYCIDIDLPKCDKYVVLQENVLVSKRDG